MPKPSTFESRISDARNYGIRNFLLRVNLSQTEYLRSIETTRLIAKLRLANLHKIEMIYEYLWGASSDPNFAFLK